MGKNEALAMSHCAECAKLQIELTKAQTGAAHWAQRANKEAVNNMPLRIENAELKATLKEIAHLAILNPDDRRYR